MLSPGAAAFSAPSTAFLNPKAAFTFVPNAVFTGAGSGEGLNPLRAQIATWNPERGLGTANRGRYSNPAVDALIDRGMATMDDDAREKIIQRAMKLAMADVPVIQLHLQKNIWATRSNLIYEPRVDEGTLAMGVRPAK